MYEKMSFLAFYIGNPMAAGRWRQVAIELRASDSGASRVQELVIELAAGAAIPTQQPSILARRRVTSPKGAMTRIF